VTGGIKNRELSLAGIRDKEEEVETQCVSETELIVAGWVVTWKLKGRTRAASRNKAWILSCSQ
jgi:hypothetical protein